MTLIYLVLAWLGGLVLADLLAVPRWPAVVVALLAAVLALAVRNERARLVLLCCCCCCAATIRYDLDRATETPRSIWRWNEQEVVFQGVVAEDPRRSADKQRLLIRVEQVQATGRRAPAEGLVLVTVPPYPQRSYGDRIAFHGTLRTPREAERPGTFDYRAYLARKHIFSISEPKAQQVIDTGNGNPLLSGLLGLRTHGQRTLMRSLPEPQSALAVGLLLGLQSAIAPDVYETFSLTGTSHILVISGWNITILAGMLAALAGRLRLSGNAAFWLTVGCIVAYTAFVGASPTAVRAAVMGGIVVLGTRLGRPVHAWTTLLAACWAMTLWNPQTLWDLGFQLSALATASLFAFGKPTERMLLRTPLRLPWLGWAREALTATLAAQVLALPLILYHFGNLSLVAPLANVLLLPVVPIAMLLGAVTLVLGMVALPLGQIAALTVYPLFVWLTEGAAVLAALPYAAVQLPPFPLWVLLAYYTLLAGLVRLDD